MSWAFPEALVLLALVPLVWLPWRRHQRVAVALPAAARLSTESNVWTRWAPALLKAVRAAALACLVIALAGPQTASARRDHRREGIAIQIVLDTSLSMGFSDYVHGDQTITRMDAAKHAIRVFVQGDSRLGLAGRSDDLIGLVVFNRHPDVLCPLTTAHDVLLASLDEVTLGPYTNIGDGLAWGLDRLRRAPVREKVLILVSDGKHNVANAMSPVSAARLAADLGIRIYAIGTIGNQEQSSSGLFGLTGSNSADSVDEPTLQRVASLTGGRYFRATDTDGLIAVYQEIDRLEKSRITRQDFVPKEDWYPLPLIAALLLLTGEALLRATRFRL
ncbi:MAG: VWA domain-containing protein, partial [Gemmatales bacterium]|nr:VWA domain-containing protein [Gemmatales bacterium]MDW8385544.1 VWA domain-containing protein [Gemmatales bacterium]